MDSSYRRLLCLRAYLCSNKVNKQLGKRLVLWEDKTQTINGSNHISSPPPKCVIMYAFIFNKFVHLLCCIIALFLLFVGNPFSPFFLLLLNV